MGRAPCCDKANVKKGPWSPEEDATLKDYIEQHGTGSNWIALPQKIGLKRCGKSCRLRWLNYLRPNIKHGSFSEEEDNIICNLYISIGSRWSIIAAQLPGRTDNDIKNYWNTRLKKKLLGKRKASPSSHSLASLNQETKDSNSVDDNSYPNTLSQSALERLQLHMQLQSLQYPFSFYNNNLALWPKLHPLGDSKCQGHKGLNQNPNPNSDQQIPNTTITTIQTGMSPNSTLFNEAPASLAETEQGNSINTNNPNVQDHELGSSFNGVSPFIVNYSNSVELMNNISKSNSVEQLNMMNYQSIFGSEAELSELLNRENGDQISSEFDSFKEMDGSSNGTSNDSMNNIWWSNEFDTKSSSPSNSWDDSTSMSVNLQTDHQGLFQDYVLEYDL